jgi:hypothetical protein
MIDALFDLFASFYERGDLASAEQIALKIRHAVPDDTVAWHLLGLLLYRTGRRDDALRAFDAADGAKHGLRLTQPDERGLSASLECLRVACRDGSRLGSAWYPRRCCTCACGVTRRPFLPCGRLQRRNRKGSRLSAARWSVWHSFVAATSALPAAAS